MQSLLKQRTGIRVLPSINSPLEVLLKEFEAFINIHIQLVIHKFNGICLAHWFTSYLFVIFIFIILNHAKTEGAAINARIRLLIRPVVLVDQTTHLVMQRYFVMG